MQRLKRTTWLYLLFFCSGIPALFYQIVWQRSLLAIYGVNIESVAIVVAAFMCGLGIGSLVGGWLSRFFLRHALLLFGFFELALGIFGFSSLSLFHWVSTITLHVSYPQLVEISFALICFPTLLMGATLPLLVAYVVHEMPNVGKSIGMLYFVNTLGGAVACIIAAIWAMKTLGLSGTVTLAASINVLIGCAALIVSSYRKPRQLEIDLAIQDETLYYRKMNTLSLPIAMSYSAMAGYIALSYEIIWMRVYGFITAGRADTFACVLGFYLCGLAFGSLISRFYCDNWRKAKTVSLLFNIVLISSLLGYVFIPLLAESLRFVVYVSTYSWLALLTTLLGMTLPLICHSAIRPDQRAGVRLSYIYFANIVGATIGSFVTGFIILQYFSIGMASVLLGILGLIFALSVLLALPISQRTLCGGVAGISFLAFAFWMSEPFLFHHVYEKFLYKESYSPDKHFSAVVENRSGIITVQPDGVIFGGGVYDGRFNVDPRFDKNTILRAYVINAFHPHPENVLMVGLSSGSWAQVIANNPDVKKLTIIEINPGYLKLIEQHSKVASVLKNLKVTVVVGDGRRWILEHQTRAFDLVVMNTTFHWREHAANLLSMNFLNKVKGVLKPQGVFYFNTTSSDEVLHTAIKTFAYGVRFYNFIAVSDSPILLNKARWQKILANYQIDGEPVFHLKQPADKADFQRSVSWLNTAYQQPPLVTGLEFESSLQKHVKYARIITDDNMASEW